MDSSSLQLFKKFNSAGKHSFGPKYNKIDNELNKIDSILTFFFFKGLINFNQSQNV